MGLIARILKKAKEIKEKEINIEIARALQKLSLEDLKVLSEYYRVPSSDRLLNTSNYAILNGMTLEEEKAEYIRRLIIR